MIKTKIIHDVLVIREVSQCPKLKAEDDYSHELVKFKVTDQKNQVLIRSHNSTDMLFFKKKYLKPFRVIGKHDEDSLEITRFQMLPRQNLVSSPYFIGTVGRF